MKKIIGLIISSIIITNTYGQVKTTPSLSKFPSLGSLISSSNECVNVINQGSGNKVFININENTNLLKSILAKLENTKAAATKTYKLVDSLLHKIQFLEKSSQISSLQFKAAEYLDTLSSLFLYKDSLTSVKANIFSIYMGAGQLKCREDLETIVLNGSKYYLTEEKDISKEDLILFETKNKNNRLLFKYRNKFGYTDSLGNIVILPQYDTAYSFSDGLAYVKRNFVGECFINDNDSNVIDLSDMKFVHVGSFHDGVALVELKEEDDNLLKSRFNYINKDGHFISYYNFYYASDFSYGLGCASSMGYYDHRIIDSSSSDEINDWLMPAFIPYLSDSMEDMVVDAINSYSEGLNLVKELKKSDDRRREFKRAWRINPPMTFEQLLSDCFSVNLQTSYAYYGKEVMRDLKSYKKVVDVVRTRIPHFGYINNRGEATIPFEYYFAEPFDDYNTARVIVASSKETSKSFLIDRNGDDKKKRFFSYYNLQGEDEYHGYLSKRVENPIRKFSGKYSSTSECTLDTSGKVFFCSNEIILSIHNDLIICENSNKKRGLLTLSGLLVLPFEYSDLNFTEENICHAKNATGEFYFWINAIGKAVKLDLK